MQHDAVHSPLGVALAPTGETDEYEARVVGRYDAQTQLVSWNGEFDDPNLGAPLCSSRPNTPGYTMCRVPGETNCSIWEWLPLGRDYTCDYDGY